ncbi:hypothetical protein DL96DRAFT_1578218 [Flagelloscypha sp. PMI_526]|nr:hypothetical protein DL96DRAFT_1578218 [Flagelloscypha sp. PMI_526]
MFLTSDSLDIVYVVDNAQQFWSELEDKISFPPDHVPSLSQLDAALKGYIGFCATYHEQYLQSPLQLEHASHMLCDSSELFVFHSERMCELLCDEVQSTTNPHTQLIIYHIMLTYGRRRTEFFRSHKRWQPLIPLLMDHVLVEIDPLVEDSYLNHGAGTSNSGAMLNSAPIEAKLRNLGVELLYEVCRVQKMSMSDLRIFDDTFLDHLFQLVEETRDMPDESFNYAVIKLIVALNEQFMVATLDGSKSPQSHSDSISDSKNRVLRVLMQRLGSSKTFGENMIFMLNRAGRTPEDLCMQLLVLKILYLLFTTHGTSEYFYTNDLCVLVDVFLRELVDLDEDSESLRHTYLRVLHPLLTRTQLKDVPYKRPQIVNSLESLLRNSRIREVNATTKRLVERCLSGEWCVQHRSREPPSSLHPPPARSASPRSESGISQAHSQFGLSSVTASVQLERSGSTKTKLLKSSKSVENFHAHTSGSSSSQKPTRSVLDGVRRGSNASSNSMTGVASAKVSTGAGTTPRRKDTADSSIVDGAYADRHRHTTYTQENKSTTSPQLSPTASTDSAPNPRRSAPPPPGKRRKPPAVPVGKTNGGATVTKIK